MPGTPPPNDALAELATLLSEQDARELVQLYLADFPGMLEALTTGPAKDHVRLAHSLKSSSQYMGATVLAERFAALEHRLGLPGETITPADLEGIAADFQQIAGPLQAFVGP